MHLIQAKTDLFAMKGKLNTEFGPFNLLNQGPSPHYMKSAQYIFLSWDRGFLRYREFLRYQGFSGLTSADLLTFDFHQMIEILHSM